MNSCSSPLRYSLATLATFLVCAYATPVNAANPMRFYKAGVKAFEAGEFRDAAEHFAKAFAIDPEPTFLFSEASCYRRVGADSAAAERYEKYLELVPPGTRPEEREKAVGYAAEARLRLAMAARETGDCVAAIKELQASLEHDPENGTAWYHLGLCRSDLAETEAARGAFRRALKDPELAPALREDAERRSAVVDPRPLAPDALTAPESAATTAPGPKKPVTRQWWLWTAVGVGAAAVAAGVISVTLAVSAPVARARRMSDHFIDVRSD